jgi:hypothetical protein
MLSVSQLLFDPGDKTTLEARYCQAGLGDRSVRLALVATKQQELIAPNLPLVWGIHSIDGFDGGLLPTAHYTAFTSLLLPNGSLRTIDGRLRENLAVTACRGACIPDPRWLNLTNTQYLITDKVFDLWHEGVAYDTQLAVTITPPQPAEFKTLPDFVTTAVDVLYQPSRAGDVPSLSLITADGDAAPLTVDAGGSIPVEAAHRLRFLLDAPVTPEALSIESSSPMTILALTLVDTRTGDFIQVAPDGWQRVLSSDIKVYENQQVLPRAFFVTEALWFDDNPIGTEMAVQTMATAGFDPARTITINHAQKPEIQVTPAGEISAAVTVSDYAATRVEISVTTDTPGYLLLTDAFYPGWQASIAGESVEILRADVMFRAVSIPAGEQVVVFDYHPPWLDWIGWVGLVSWAGLLAAIVGLRWIKHR